MSQRVHAFRARSVRQGSFGCTTGILSSVLVLLLVSVGAAAISMFSPGNTNFAASRLQAQPGSLRWDGGRWTMLLLGANGKAARTSSITGLLVVSFDQHHRRLATLSVPPNLWVTIPGFGRGTMADAYTYGGSRLVLLTMQSSLHMPIPYYAVMGTNTVGQLADAVGGVSVHLSPALAGRFDARVSRPTIQSGTQRMDGATLTRFMQLPAVTAAEIMLRMQRQYLGVTALLTAAMQPASLPRLAGLVDNFGGTIITNFPYNQIVPLAQTFQGTSRLGAESHYLTVPNNAVADYTAEGKPVLLPNWPRIHSIVQSAFPNADLARGSGVQVQNRTGTAGRAAAVGGWLRQSGVRIDGESSAPSVGFTRTHVIVGKNAGTQTQYVARAVSTMLQAPLITDSARSIGAPIIVIIGDDYQDVTQE